MSPPGPHVRQPSPQKQAALNAARALIEADGPSGLTMRRLGARLGVRAQSLYEHFPSKAALETALCAQLLWECGDRTAAAAANGTSDPLLAICEEQRGWALAHPDLYRLGWCGPLDRTSPEIVAAETHAAAALLRATDEEPATARAVYAFVHGVILLELERRLPRDTGADDLYRVGITTIRHAARS